jgi:V8-like Glu-specific endopeptidase
MYSNLPTFQNAKGEALDSTTAIVPLISQNKTTNDLFFIGTAFYITSRGLLITAKHNIFDKKEIFENLGVFHFIPGDKYALRSIRKISYSLYHDIAILIPDIILDQDKNVITNQIISLARTEPEIGEQLSMYGFPNPRLEKINERQILDLKSNFYLGENIEYYPHGFSILKNACYHTSIKIGSGASGAPVFNKTGKAFAICSTSFDTKEGEENISFVTPLALAFDLPIIDGSGNAKTLNELSQMKMIFLE